jgi:hypothetical protein
MHALVAAVLGSTLFPLTPGEHWTLRDVNSGAKTQISVRTGRVLHGLPGSGALRVRQSGQTVQAWDPKDRRWEDLFRFGARKGTRYTVALGATALWRKVAVRIATKKATVRDYHRRAHRGCTRFVFDELTGIADAGMLDMAFCPRVGPVRFSETTIAGPRTYALA